MKNWSYLPLKNWSYNLSIFTYTLSCVIQRVKCVQYILSFPVLVLFKYLILLQYSSGFHYYGWFSFPTISLWRFFTGWVIKTPQILWSWSYWLILLWQNNPRPTRSQVNCPHVPYRSLYLSYCSVVRNITTKKKIILCIFDIKNTHL